MVVTRHIAEAAEALRSPYGAKEIRTNLGYDPVFEEWHLNWECSEESLDLKMWALKICGWLQYKYPDGPA